MAFDWMQPHIGSAARARWASAARQAYLRDVRERAALLRRLGYEPQAVSTRCLRRARWEFELLRRQPVDIDEVQRVVEATGTRANTPA